MSFLIYSLGLEQSYHKDFIEHSKFYNYQYYKFDTFEDMCIAIKQTTQKTVVIINIDMYGTQGFEYCAHLRIRPNTYVMFASTDNKPKQRVRWLNIGASTNLCLPFFVQEVIYRSIQLTTTHSNSVVTDSNFILDLHTHKVFYKGEKIKLTCKQFDLLVYLIEHRNRVISREEALAYAFHSESCQNIRSIDTIVKRLRLIIDPKQIMSVRGCGYQYIENPLNTD